MNCKISYGPQYYRLTNPWRKDTLDDEIVTMESGWFCTYNDGSG